MPVSLAVTMRDILIAHIDGPAPFVASDSAEVRCKRAAIKRGWLRFDERFIRPKATLITELGRTVIAEALGDWADALVRAGYSRIEPPEARKVPVIVDLLGLPGSAEAQIPLDISST